MNWLIETAMDAWVGVKFLCATFFVSYVVTAAWCIARNTWEQR